jgi:hypothetical protein
MPQKPPLPPLDFLLENGYQFEPMQYLSAAWTLFKQFVGGFVLFTLVVLIGLRIAEELPNWLGLIVQLILSVTWAGYFWVCFRLDSGEKPTLSDFMRGFKHWRLLAPVAIATISPLVFALFCTLYLPLPLGLAALCLGLVLVALFMFALPMAVIYGIGLGQAIGYSSRLALQNIVRIGFFFLLLLGINLVAIPTIIGVPLTIPLSACAIYCAMKHIFQQTA